MPPPETAEVLVHVEQAEKVFLFHMLPRSQSVEIFSYLDSSIQESLLTELTDAGTQEISTKLRPDDRTDLLEGLPRETLSRLLRLLNPQDLQEARHLLEDPEESVRRLMTPDFVAVRPGWAIEQSLTFEHEDKAVKPSVRFM